MNAGPRNFHFGTPTFTLWEKDENKLFEQALADFGTDNPNLYQLIQTRIPWRSTLDIAKHFQDLLHDLNMIESGLVPLPRYEDDPEVEEKEIPARQQILLPAMQQIPRDLIQFPAEQQTPMAQALIPAKHQILQMMNQIPLNQQTEIPAKQQISAHLYQIPPKQHIPTEMIRIPAEQPIPMKLSQIPDKQHVPAQLIQIPAKQHVPVRQTSIPAKQQMPKEQTLIPANQQTPGVGPKKINRGRPWNDEEHQNFLKGLEQFGKGDWKSISRVWVPSRTPTQVASHAQKHFQRQQNDNPKRRKKTIFKTMESSSSNEHNP